MQSAEFSYDYMGRRIEKTGTKQTCKIGGIYDMKLFAKISWGCIILIISISGLIVITTKIFSVYFYIQDNSKRKDSTTNLNNFSNEFKRYLISHDDKYPPSQGVRGLRELDIVLISDFAAKDDKEVMFDYDVMREQNTSYAYVASNLSAKGLGDRMPIVFEKPWNKNDIHVLMSDGRIEILRNMKFKNCRSLIEHFKKQSKEKSFIWDTLIENAQYIDNAHNR